jgi:demethylmenaquinone methyltransferase/2-methoxy-6-polyprenyl-1,4-benzoquinol methylase
MTDHSGRPHDLPSLLASQRAFYDARADDFGDESKPDRRVPGLITPDACQALVDAIQPSGDVLELACGTGAFTGEIARHARTLTAVDASPRMLAINRERVNDPKVAYVQADIFTWAPGRVFDMIFFGFWLSHVPPSAFDDFWARVRAWLAPGGRVAFVDEDERAAGYDDVRLIDGAPAARRSLSDGRQFDIVKVFWRPDELEQRLHSIDWDIDVRRTGATFLLGAGHPGRPL